MTQKAYDTVKGPITMEEFIMDGLSDETIFRIFQEKAGLMFVSSEVNEDPILSMREHVGNLFNVAVWNLLGNMHVDGHISEECRDHIFNQ